MDSMFFNPCNPPVPEIFGVVLNDCRRYERPAFPEQHWLQYYAVAEADFVRYWGRRRLDWLRCALGSNDWQYLHFEELLSLVSGWGQVALQEHHAWQEWYLDLVDPGRHWRLVTEAWFREFQAEWRTVAERELLPWLQWRGGDSALDALKESLAAGLPRSAPVERFTQEGAIREERWPYWRVKVARSWRHECNQRKGQETKYRKCYERWWQEQEVLAEAAERRRLAWSVEICRYCGAVLGYPYDHDCPWDTHNRFRRYTYEELAAIALTLEENQS